MKTFYRVCNTKTRQGLWYNQKGEFTGLIHNKFNFCQNSKLEIYFNALLDDRAGLLQVYTELKQLLKTI